MFKSLLLQTFSSLNCHCLLENRCTSLLSSLALKCEPALSSQASYCESLAILFNKSVCLWIDSLKDSLL